MTSEVTLYSHMYKLVLAPTNKSQTIEQHSLLEFRSTFESQKYAFGIQKYF